MQTHYLDRRKIISRSAICRCLFQNVFKLRYLLLCICEKFSRTDIFVKKDHRYLNLKKKRVAYKLILDTY